ncbi:hypothetical protein G4B88_008545 [Cannabis sativa]|uniref:RNase H type-1 domain-containing protein n=1 Tax=Cannabis sativa TaxID=3483 RepID=A0A7J6EJ79_CANSA|nr:hypothetical protein G4B88_008545 [Cannabis sativa]
MEQDTLQENTAAESFVLRFNGIFSRNQLLSTPEENVLSNMRIIENDNLRLLCIPTEKEIEGYLRSMGHDNAPGPNGMRRVSTFRIGVWSSPLDATPILNIDLPDEATEDSWVWLGEPNGKFSISIGWGIRTELVTATNWKQWLDGFWKGPNLPPNVAFYDFTVTCLCIVESVWRERNRRVYGEKDMDIIQITNSIRQKINDHIMVSSKRVQEITEWSLPPSDWVSCNSDVAVSSTGFTLSAVIRDDLGNIISISSQQSRVTLPKLAEAQAVCLVVEKANDLGLKKVIFQSDNLCVVKAFEAPMSMCMDFMLQEAKASIGWGIRTELVTATNWKQWLDGFWKGPNLPPNVAFYDFTVTCLCIVESVWRETNRRVYGEKDMDIIQITNSIRQKINDHIMVSSKRVQEITEWSPPPSDWVCCNSDVAVSSTGFTLSAVILDDLGNIISISSQQSRVTLPKLAEAQAAVLKNVLGNINLVEVEGSVLDDLREWDPGAERGTIGSITVLG